MLILECPNIAARVTRSIPASTARVAHLRHATGASRRPQARARTEIKFEWREADKNLEKEVRNAPLDTTAQGQDLMQLETRSWKGNDPVSPMTTPNANYGAKKSGFRSRN